MKCMETFYNKEYAVKFYNELLDANWGACPEIVETIDEDADNEPCWIVYYNPKPLRRLK